jgi:hypothetical protein
MDYLDFIRELRKGEPNIKKAEKALKILGWICIFGAVWNFVFPLVAPSFENSFKFPRSYRLTALVSFSIVGILCRISSRGIKQKAPWGVHTAQISIVLAFVTMVLLVTVLLFLSGNRLPDDPTFRVILATIFALVFGQFFILTFFALRYLGRLPVRETDILETRFEIGPNAYDKATETQSLIPDRAQIYKDALFPFGILGTFALLVGGLLITVFTIEKFLGESMMIAVFLPGFALVFFGPIIYNRLPSPFEKGRQLVASYTGGGSLLLFGGTWPFFRLMVSDDGLEVRVMFHRFFIPYEHMEDIPEKVGFFSRGILIKSDLPGVPSGIRFMTFGVKKAVQTIVEAKTTAKGYMENPGVN